MLFLLFSLVGWGRGKEYTKHIQPIDYEVPHSVMFRGELCWSRDVDSEITVPSNCTENYCSQCYFNQNIRDYRNHLMSYNDNRLVVGALDKLLAFDVTDSLFQIAQIVSNEPGDIMVDAQPGCVGDIKADFQQCRNYNRVLLQLNNNDKLLTCGTLAYKVNSACQIRQIKDLSEFDTFNGEGFVPINERARNTAIYTDSRIFSGTLVSALPEEDSFAISSAKLTQTDTYKFTSIVSTKMNINWLNRAKFVASFSYGDYVYFFFQELDYHQLDRSQSVVSRVARVCKEDAGVPDVDLPLDNARLWQTFVKARIYCTNEVNDRIFGTQVYRYNRIGDAVLDDDIVYATFSEGDTSASGSVVCRYNMADIDNIFDTGFYYNLKESTNPNIESTKIKKQLRTAPTCGNDGDFTSDDIYSLILASKDVKSQDPPLFLQSGPQFTKLLLDSNMKSKNFGNPVLFIGTNMGKVLKVTWLDTETGIQPILIEQLNVAVGDISSDLSVYFLAFEKTSDPNYLFVGTGTSVSKVVISRCLRISNLSQQCCMASRDPYCGWCPQPGKCTSRADCSSDWIQSLTYDGEDTCSGQDDSIEPAPTPAADKAETSTPPETDNIVREQDSWKTVAIVMAILCGIFVLISLILAANLARRWCSSHSKPPLKTGNHNLHNYNPLTTNGPKSDDFSDRIPVYNTRTHAV